MRYKLLYGHVRTTGHTISWPTRYQVVAANSFYDAYWEDWFYWAVLSKAGGRGRDHRHTFREMLDLSEMEVALSGYPQVWREPVG